MKDGDRKKFEKKKQFRNVEKLYDKYDKFDMKKYKTDYVEPTTEKFLKNEVNTLVDFASLYPQL